MRAGAIKTLLPGVFEDAAVDGSALAGLLEAMEALHQPREELLDRLDTTFDPRRAPARFVPFLARWVGIDFDVSSGLGLLRELVAASVALSRMRGTRRGLGDFLRTATGVGGFAIAEELGDASGRARQFHIRVRAPAETRPHEAMIRAIIEREKPAYVTWQLEFSDDAPAPTTDAPGAKP